MEKTQQIIVHGRGNAWPVLLGETHPFYDRTDPRDLSNAAFSLVASENGKITGDVLVDAGHGTVQSLITGSNRIPGCICLTHGHMDHTLSVDWVVQSFWQRYNREKRYPVYTTAPVYHFLIRSYPHLEDLIEYRELSPGITQPLDHAMPFKLTSYPVYHGKSAAGASMLLFETDQKRVLFTGDLFSPLLRLEDYHQLKGVDLVVVDANNRFPWPRTNHWSFAGQPGKPMERSEALNAFLDSLDWEELTTPHGPEACGKTTRSYFKTLRDGWSILHQPFTILEFLKKIEPRRVMLVHYSGTEDSAYYNEPILPAHELQDWVTRTAQIAGIDSHFIVPEAGQIISI
ncbi:MAG: MBL fold metallo-hydrolase [Bacteroidales bacterium]|nr:MBL fold metallo-hydrolase [Bacteroidales bacterium]